MIKDNSIYNSSNPTNLIMEHSNWVSGDYPSRLFESAPAKRCFRNQLLNSLPEKAFVELTPYLETVCFSSGDYIYQPGDRVDFVYFPETAVISEFQILEDGRSVEIAMTGNEGMLGLLPLFNSGTAVNWTQISVNGTAAKISRRLFEEKIVRRPDFQKMLFEYITEYVRQISQRSVCNSYHVIEQRFCSWLLMIQERKQSNKIPLTQEQISRSLGVHRPSLTHIAQNLRAKKIIDYVRGKIYILDRKELEKSACACFAEICRHSETL